MAGELLPEEIWKNGVSHGENGEQVGNGSQTEPHLRGRGTHPSLPGGVLMAPQGRVEEGRWTC